MPLTSLVERARPWAAVVDPQERDVQVYAEFAKAKGMEIKYVIDTHIQADHLSGGRSLSERTGAFLLTGDTLFVGEVGRPDLPGNAQENAAQLYDSLKMKVLDLPETLEIYPAHFSGSLCGAGISGKPMSTLAFEKRWNPTLNLDRCISSRK